MNMKPIGVAAVLAVILASVPALGENLYSAEEYRPLTADRKANRVGDLLTVLVVENASASATAGEKTDKTHDAGIRMTSPSHQRDYALGLNDNYDGSGKIARTGKLLAQLSVAVTDVAPNGDLRVKGEQLLELNGEKQTIYLEGRVRRADISDSNTVPSNRIADAHITYVGDGVLADSQRKGLLTRLIFAFLQLF